jgi:hypothetical protein
MKLQVDFEEGEGKFQDPSSKLQVTSPKLQAPSFKPQGGMSFQDLPGFQNPESLPMKNPCNNIPSQGFSDGYAVFTYYTISV